MLAKIKDTIIIVRSFATLDLPSLLLIKTKKIIHNATVTTNMIGVATFEKLVKLSISFC